MHTTSAATTTPPKTLAASINAAVLGVIIALIAVAAVCVAVMPRVVDAQNLIAENLGACMSESDCLQDPAQNPIVSGARGGATVCTEKFCFSRTAASKCTGTTGVCYVRGAAPEFAVPIGRGVIRDLPDYIQAVYDIALGIAAVLAATMMMVGGFQYVTSAGDAGRAGEGKKRITDALIGLVLTASAWLLLNTVNPNLLRLELPMIPLTSRQVYVQCQRVEHCRPCGVEFDIKLPEGGELTGACGDDVIVEKGLGDATCMGVGCNIRAMQGGGASSCDGTAQICVLASSGKVDVCGAFPANRDTSTWVCAGCRPDGMECSGKGPSEDCCGGFCSDGKCSGGHDGIRCESSNECRSGVCATAGPLVGGVIGPSTAGWCSSGKLGMPCSNDNECSGSYKCVGEGVLDFGSCLPGVKYSNCHDNNDCQAGLECNSEAAITGGVCMPPGEEPSAAFFTGCGALYPVQGFCSGGGPGAPCFDGSHCARQGFVREGATTGVCVQHQASLLSGAGGLNGLGFCSSGEAGSFCRNTAECAPSLYCYKDQDLGVCQDGSLGSQCSGSGQCQQGFICTSNRCILAPLPL